MLAAAIAVAGADRAARPRRTLTQAAFDDLKHGGFVVVFRHGKTDAPAGAPEDKSPLDLANCADQAMLSEAGQEQARAVGRAFVSAGIPVGKVLASGYCRAIEMARLAFGHVETSDALLLPNFVPVAGAAAPPPWRQRVEIMKKMVATVPEAIGQYDPDHAFSQRQSRARGGDRFRRCGHRQAGRPRAGRA